MLPVFRSVALPTAVMVAALLLDLSGIGVKLSRMVAVVMVIFGTVVTVVVVGGLGPLAMPMLFRRVMHVRLFEIVMCGMMVASREPLFDGEARDRGHHDPGQDM